MDFKKFEIITLTCHLKSSFLLFKRFTGVNYSNSRSKQQNSRFQNSVRAYENFVFVLEREDRENGLLC